jgi:hypothetical protein
VTDNTTIVVKTHEWYDKHKYDKAVILIRSPFKSCSSHFNGEVTGEHKGMATKEQYESRCDIKNHYIESNTFSKTFLQFRFT